MKIACAAQITNASDANLSGLIEDEEVDVNVNVEELKYHENKNKLANSNFDVEHGKNKKQKMSIDQRAGILTVMLRIIPMKEKHDKLKRAI